MDIEFIYSYHRISDKLNPVVTKQHYSSLLNFEYIYIYIPSKAIESQQCIYWVPILGVFKYDTYNDDTIEDIRRIEEMS